MPRPHAAHRLLDRPAAVLVLVFALWKSFLLLAAFCSPGPGYDTSTTLLLGQDAAASALATASVPWTATIGDRLASKLARWDAIYFVKAAERGYAYEQEWAFSWGLNRTIALLANSLPFLGPAVVAQIWSGVIIATLAHLLSVLVLHRLAAFMLPGSGQRVTTFLTAALHVFSPAGLFLTAPYGEPVFAFLNFSGMLCYAYAHAQDGALSAVGPGAWHASTKYLLTMLASGGFFAAATMVRSNGLLSGLIFLLDVPKCLAGIFFQPQSERRPWLRRLFCTVLAGVTVSTGLVVPQWLAYQEYCVGVSTLHSLLGDYPAYADQETTRPWCTQLPPSIYTFVQKHYWNVGFLRYWTLSNVPLFLLAAPMVWIMTSSGLRVIQRFSGGLHSVASEKSEHLSMRAETPHLLVAFAVPQIALAVLAVTNFHVQIINRICSGYPIWYLAIASGLDSAGPLQSIAVASKDASTSIFRLAIMYAVVQGALFASFLPPA